MIILKYCARLKIKVNSLTLYSLHVFSSTSPWIKSPKPGPLKFDDRRRKPGFRQIRPSMIFLKISDRDLELDTVGSGDVQEGTFQIRTQSILVSTTYGYHFWLLILLLLDHKLGQFEIILAFSFVLNVF